MTNVPNLNLYGLILYFIFLEMLIYISESSSLTVFDVILVIKATFRWHIDAFDNLSLANKFIIAISWPFPTLSVFRLIKRKFC